MTNDAIKFNFYYDVEKLKDELSFCFAQKWANHFNTKDYLGTWNSIALRSATGDSNDIYAKSGQQYRDTALLSQLPYIKEVLNTWNCEKESIRLMALSPGSEIKTHKDFDCDYMNGSFRLHIPIQTNDRVLFNVNQNTYALAEGSCWFLDFSKAHSVSNLGETRRIHLVIDAIRNEWTDQLFKSNGYDLSPQKMDLQTVLMVIKELGVQDTIAAKTLITQLKNEYAL